MAGEETLIVTIDGPAGAGKSSVARRVARAIGVEFLDTGAMYRGIAATAIDRRISTGDKDAVAELALAVEMKFDWATDPPALHVDGADVTGRLRDEDVTAAVSDIATNAAVRRVMVATQQAIGRAHRRLVTEGRDQGSVVFPDACVKFYLDASPDVRARRRAEQLRAAGREADENVIRKQIIARDHRDASRSDGPLICPDNAIRIDTSDMTETQVIDTLVRNVQSRTTATGGCR